jgi:hypothetical protein
MEPERGGANKFDGATECDLLEFLDTLVMYGAGLLLERLFGEVSSNK